MVDEFLEISNDNMMNIKNNLELLGTIGLKETIVLELIGTPKSGKTTLKTLLEQLFKRYNVPHKIFGEVDDYEPIEKTGTTIDYFIFCEQIQRVLEINNESNGVVVCDRGLFDRLIWLEYDRLKGRIDDKEYSVFENLVKDVMAIHYKPEAFVFVTSPQTCIGRKGNEGSVVNLSNMRIYNNALRNKMEFIAKNSGSVHEIYTDLYEDNVEDFSGEMVLLITNRLVEVLKTKKKS